MVLCHINHCLRNIHGMYMRCPTLCGIQSKAAGMGKAIQNMLSLRNACNRSPIVFLIEKKSGFLTIFNIHIIGNSILNYAGKTAFRMLRQNGMLIPAFCFLKALQLTDSHIITLIDSSDSYMIFISQNLHKHGKQHILSLLHTIGECLHDQQIMKTVNCQSG